MNGKSLDPLDSSIMEYTIQNCDESVFKKRADEFAELCRKAFAEHIQRNVKMGPGYMSSSKWIEQSEGCIGQFIEVDGKIIAFWSAYPDYVKQETLGKILAVEPSYKGKHIGILLVHSRTSYLRELGMKAYITDTSLKAPHIVNFHKSYGCKPVGMTSWPNTNYYTVILRQALFPEFEISNFEAKKRFLISKVKCRMTLKEDGSRTFLGKLYSSIIAFLFSKNH